MNPLSVFEFEPNILHMITESFPVICNLKNLNIFSGYSVFKTFYIFAWSISFSISQLFLWRSSISSCGKFCGWTNMCTGVPHCFHYFSLGFLVDGIPDDGVLILVIHVIVIYSKLLNTECQPFPIIACSIFLDQYDSVNTIISIRSYVKWSSLKNIVERGEVKCLEILLFLAKTFWTWFRIYSSSEHSNECKFRPAIAGKINGTEKSNKIGQQ